MEEKTPEKIESQQVPDVTTTPTVFDTDQGTESKKSVFLPGTFGTYMSYGLLIAGMVTSIVCRRYSTFPVIGSINVGDCPSGYEDACLANSVVLRISFALSLIFFLQLILAMIVPSFYDSWWIVKLCVFVAIVVGFFYAKGDVFDSNGDAFLLLLL